MPAFRPGTASSYPSVQTISNVKFAAAKYETDDQTRAAFGKLNPNEYGVLPVLLVVENGNQSNILLDRMEIYYQLPDGRKVEPTPAAELPYLIAPKRPNTGPSYPNPLPIQIKKKNPLTNPDLDARTFAAKALLPGESAHGFYYFQVRHRVNSVLYISGVREGATGKELFFAEVPIDEPPAQQ